MDLLLKSAAAAPSPWVLRWAHLIRAGGAVLDLACGSGRHLRWLAAEGFRVTGVDRDTGALEGLRAAGDGPVGVPAEIIVADLEANSWPLPGRRFDGIVVTNYLWRPLLPTIAEALAAGGVVIYETFADGQQTLGKPSNPQFLLQPGELLRAFAGLRIVAFEDGYESSVPRHVQRIVAQAPALPGHAGAGARLELAAPAR